MGALCTSRHFAGGPLQGALETDWLAGAAGFEPLHVGINPLNPRNPHLVIGDMAKHDARSIFAPLVALKALELGRPGCN
jgi:hypothetical protein